MSHYIVASSRAKMPTTCWGRYRRVAVLEVEDGVSSVAMISDRARGCVRVVRTWERLYEGTTERCAYRVALSEAWELAEALNAGEGVPA